MTAQEGTLHTQFSLKRSKLIYPLMLRRYVLFSTSCFAQPGTKEICLLTYYLYRVGPFKISMLDLGIQLSAYM